MNENDKNKAEALILKKLNFNVTSGQNCNTSVANTPQQQVNDPLDVFLAECGVSSTVFSTTVHPVRQRTPKEELAFYLDTVQGCKVFGEFCDTYQHDLPLMVALVRAYNIRPASNVPSESLFSVAGYVHRKNRSSLAADTLCYSMVLRDRNIAANLAE